MNYPLRHPPAGLTGFLRLIWPLIFVQLVALKRWVRAHYGPGVPYWYGITKWGRVLLRHLPAPERDVAAISVHTLSDTAHADTS